MTRNAGKTCFQRDQVIAYVFRRKCAQHPLSMGVSNIYRVLRVTWIVLWRQWRTDVLTT